MGDAEFAVLSCRLRERIEEGEYDDELRKLIKDYIEESERRMMDKEIKEDNALLVFARKYIEEHGK